jgi:hypothetical protein
VAKDPGLQSDTCIFAEATAGDGGAHTAPEWWLSPDVVVTGPATTGDATPNVDNTVRVRAHRKSNCTVPSTASAVRYDVYVAFPGPMPPAPNNPGTTKLISGGLSTFGPTGQPPTRPNDIPSGGSVEETFLWKPQGTQPTDPDASGHRCLILRLWPNHLNPTSDNFFLPEEPHCVQHNLCIIPCGPGVGGGGGPGEPGEPGGPIDPNVARFRRGVEGEEGGEPERSCQFELRAANADAAQPADVTLRMAADQRPSKAVLNAILPHLQAVPGFRRVSSTPLERFIMALPDFPNAPVRDRSRPQRPGGLLGLLLRLLRALLDLIYRLFGIDLFPGQRPSYEADIRLGPGQFTNFLSAVDLTGTTAGDAHVLHVTQLGQDRQVQGGVTLVFVTL